MPQRGPRVAVAERAQPGLRALGGEPHLGGRDPRHRLQQRRVEQPLVQREHPAGGPAPQVGELLGVRQADAAGEPALVGLVGGHQVGAAQLVQLQAVLEQALQPVGGVEVVAVRSSDVAVGDQRVQGFEGAAQPQPLVRPAVDELQQLDAELDVPQPAGAQLDLVVGLDGGQQRHHPAAHRLGLGDELVVVGDPPDHRPHHVDELLGELQVACHRPGFEHRLELPVLRPALVIGAVRGERADKGAGLAFGTQRGVDLPDRPGGGLGAADPHHRPDQLGGDLNRLVSAAHRVAVGVQGGFGEVEQVDVADVVELAGAGLAERDDAQPGDLPALHLAAGQREGGDDGGVGQVGQLLGDLGQDGDGVGRGEVTGGDAQQGSPVGAAQVVGASRVGYRLLALGGYRGQQFGPQVGGGAASDVSDEQIQLLGVDGQVLGERHAGAQHAGEPPGPGRVRPQRRDHVRPGLRYPGEPGECQIRVSRSGEFVQEHRPALLAERLRPRLGHRRVARRIAEPPPRQLGGERLGANHGAIVTPPTPVARLLTSTLPSGRVQLPSNTPPGRRMCRPERLYGGS